MPRISTDNYDTVASWNGSQDLFVVEQPDGTKVATPAMVKQYVLGNSIDDIYSVMGQMGAKNLISYPYDYSSRPSLSGITYTINADNSITMNGTTTARTNYWLYDHGQGFMGLKSGDYILSKTGRTDVSFIVAFYKGSTWVKQVTATENDITVSIDVNSSAYDNIGIAISFGAAGITVENATVYPMLRLASDTDNAYQPYAMTNKQLTEEIGDLSQTGLTGDSVAAQLGDVNNKVNIVSSISPGPNLTMLKGVYVKIGTLVIVNLVCRATGAITPDSVVCSVPTNYMANAPLNIYINSQLVSGSNCRIFNGSVRAGANVSSGTEFCIQGSYISTT